MLMTYINGTGFLHSRNTWWVWWGKIGDIMTTVWREDLGRADAEGSDLLNVLGLYQTKMPYSISGIFLR